LKHITAQHSAPQRDGREQMCVEQDTAGLNRIQQGRAVYDREAVVCLLCLTGQRSVTLTARDGTGWDRMGGTALSGCLWNNFQAAARWTDRMRFIGT
jgi:hypothetical protein